MVAFWHSGNGYLVAQSGRKAIAHRGMTLADLLTWCRDNGVKWDERDPAARSVVYIVSDKHNTDAELLLTNLRWL